MRLIVAGSRSLKSYKNTRKLIEFAVRRFGWQVTEMYCGEAIGPDRHGRRWAKRRGIPVRSFPANWDGLGKRAGMVRNEHMACLADAVIVRWDGESAGTRHMIELIDKYKLPAVIWTRGEGWTTKNINRVPS